MQDTFARATHSAARPSVRATIGYLVYKSSSCPTSDALSPHHHFDSLTYKPLGWAIGLIYKLKSIADA